MILRVLAKVGQKRFLSYVMNSKKHITVFVFVAGAILAALSLGAASSERPTFEYTTESHADLRALNKLGAEGWELVCVTVTPTGNSMIDTAYLRRLKR
jgi:hypothetical protein